jgi:hypothetical protein
MENSKIYECEICDYWEAVHGLNEKNYKDEKYKKCASCGKRVKMYKDFVEKQGV